MEIGDKVRINCKDSKYHQKTGYIDDFENLKLRGSENLALVRFSHIFEWFYIKELEPVVNEM